jgi:hypothetical protein
MDRPVRRTISVNTCRSGGDYVRSILCVLAVLVSLNVTPMLAQGSGSRGFVATVPQDLDGCSGSLCGMPQSIDACGSPACVALPTLTACTGSNCTPAKAARRCDGGDCAAAPMSVTCGGSNCATRQSIDACAGPACAAVPTLIACVGLNCAVGRLRDGLPVANSHRQRSMKHGSNPVVAAAQQFDGDSAQLRRTSGE